MSFLEYTNNKGLIDIWRSRNPNVNKYTWCRAKPYVLLERLDYIFISYNLSCQVMDSDIDPSFNV